MTVATVTCGDLALLGEEWDALARHDPRHQRPGYETTCLCYSAGPPRESDYRSDGTVTCREITPHPLWTGTDELRIEVCCLCLRRFGDALRARPVDGLLAWLREQVRDALDYRDRRRFDSSPTISDMDLEVAGMEVER